MIVPILRPVNVIQDQGYLIKLFNYAYRFYSVEVCFKKAISRALNYFNFKLYSRA